MTSAVRTIVAAVAFISASLVGPAPATARPADAVAEKQAEAARLSRQLDEQGKRISVLAEEYNEARIAAERVEADLARASSQLRATDSDAEEVRSRLREQAVESYVRGGALPALAMLVQTKVDDDLSVRRQYVATITGRLGDTLRELGALEESLRERRAELKSARASARAALAEVEAAKEQAAAAHAAHQRLLDRVRGEVAVLVAAEEKRKAEAEARRVAAALQAKRERDVAASREASRTTTTARAVPATETTARPTTTARPATTHRTTTTTTTTAPRLAARRPAAIERSGRGRRRGEAPAGEAVRVGGLGSGHVRLLRPDQLGVARGREVSPALLEVAVVGHVSRVARRHPTG